MIFKSTFVELWFIYICICQLQGMEEDPTSKSGMAGFGVWYSVKDIINILNQNEYYKLPGVRALVSTYQDVINNNSYDRNIDPPVEQRFPFICVEATHRDSRIIVGKELANFLQGTYLGNPPRTMVPLRQLFDREKGVIRKAFFSLCMYVGAHHVRETWTKEPIVTTGYWLDQAAFSIAQRFTLETLPPPNSSLYQWPEDLVRPDIAFFLNIPQLKQSARPVNTFKPKLIEVYRRIKGVKIIEINSTGTYRKIFDIIRKRLGRMSMLRENQQKRKEEEKVEDNNYYSSDYQNR